MKLNKILLNGTEYDIEAVDNLLAVANQVYRAELKTDTPIKLIERLQAAYTELGYEDDFSMLENLNPTTKFVFGPPGTGKSFVLGIINSAVEPLSTKDVAYMVGISFPTAAKALNILVEAKEIKVTGEYDKKYTKN